MKTKICIICNKEKELKEFNTRKDSSGGYRNDCKECRSINNKNYRNKNKNILKEKSKIYAKNNKEHIKLYKKSYYKKNRQLILEKCSEYRKQNKYKKYLTDKNYRENNKLKVSVLKKNYRARKKNAEGKITKQLIEKLFYSQSAWCYYCGTDISQKFHVEHKTPLSRSGSNLESNLCLSCEKCNLEKGNRTEQEYLEWLMK